MKMTVKEFSDRIGIPSSKIRFYNRSKLIESSRIDENNYRYFNNNDAISIYNAQLLRSFNLGLQDVIKAQNEDLVQLNSRVGIQISDLEKSIRDEEIRLSRLKEMKRYFELVETYKSKVSYHELEKSYNIWTINCQSSVQNENVIKLLADVMPFSYIAIRIKRESVINKTKPLDVAIGLGILESNRKKIGLEFPSDLKPNGGGKVIRMLLETKDPFSISIDDISPLITELEKNNLEIKEDIIGRFFVSYKKNNEIVHGIGFGCTI